MKNASPTKKMNLHNVGAYISVTSPSLRIPNIIWENTIYGPCINMRCCLKCHILNLLLHQRNLGNASVAQHISDVQD